ncbi:MAG: GatB/YqeY domain-containing protein [Gammaproteobacteria bacterium]|nr:GatB/YqeY domain-containing protein [Gammaproteobacteria bacterium]
MADTIKDRIREDMKASMKGGDKARLGVIRMMMAAVKQREVDERIELDDDQVILILDKMLKQRRESISQFRSGDRIDLAEIEEQEILVIQDFLPQALTDNEVSKLIEEAIAESGATQIRDMGKVMGILKPKMQGRTDMALVSSRVKELLATG